MNKNSCRLSDLKDLIWPPSVWLKTILTWTFVLIWPLSVWLKIIPVHIMDSWLNPHILCPLSWMWNDVMRKRVLLGNTWRCWGISTQCWRGRFLLHSCQRSVSLCSSADWLRFWLPSFTDFLQQLCKQHILVVNRISIIPHYSVAPWEALT